MKIADISIRNFKKIKLAALELKDWNEVIGVNAAGKSTLADAVQAALNWAGVSKAIVKPVTEGERNGEIQVTLEGDMSYVVKRTFIASGKTQVEVRVADSEETLPTPQTLLDTMVGGKLVDASEFVRLKPKDQIDELLDACGLAQELSKLDAERSKLYAERTLVGRDRDKAQKAMEALGVVTETKRVDVSEVSAERDRLMVLQQGYNAAMNHRDECQINYNKLKGELRAAEAALVSAEKALNGLEYPDTFELDEKLAQATEINTAADHWEQYRRHNEEYQRSKTEYEAQTRAIEYCDTTKADLLESADLGVPGLAFDADGITLNGIPLSQCSRSEQLRVGIEVAIKRLPADGVRWIAIREFAFSQDTKDELRKRFADSGIQFLIEDDSSETDDSDGVLIIEVDDGEVKTR